ncbi:MAG: electron transfer flavoprotein subunit alpha/FixB family protein, partial [Chloroflexi bacterium]|nr:electron transfer flavoprotein subunit alpha/FixB family protein [Chloroflexota bacterium]
FAAALGLGVSAAALGPSAATLAPQLGAAGADRVFVSEDGAFDGWPADAVATGLAQIAAEADARVVLIGSTRRGKETAPRLAQKLGAGCITDVNGLAIEDNALVAKRYAYGGATLAREKLLTRVQVLAIMPKTFSAEGAAAGAGAVVTPALQVSTSVTVVERRAREGTAVNLDAAPRIVGIGRGLAKREDLALVDQLARALEAVVGCTKSIADFQWLGEDRIIGLSGAKTAPDLYLALGISGQIQHTVGISAAKLIAAVNRDKEAPIFQIADYAIIGDLYQLVPALVERLARV